MRDLFLLYTIVQIRLQTLYLTYSLNSKEKLFCQDRQKHDKVDFDWVRNFFRFPTDIAKILLSWNSLAKMIV